jgi:hypothetical protein
MKAKILGSVTLVSIGFVFGYFYAQSAIETPHIRVSNNSPAQSAYSNAPTSSKVPIQEQITGAEAKNIQNQNALENSTNATDLVEEISELLELIDANPNQRSLALKLVVKLEKLSIDELLLMAPSFQNKSETQRNSINRFIIGQLIEKAPEQALSFAQRNNPMRDSPFYLDLITTQIAEKRPDLGFEYLDEILVLENEDIDLAEHNSLINALAKIDIDQLVPKLARFEDKGIKLEESLRSLASGLQTSDEHLTLFDGLRELDNISILDSVVFHWVRVSPEDALERIALIEDSNERQQLGDSAFLSWMYNEPEQAASYKLSNSENRLEAVKEILKRWPSENAPKAINWISKQNDIDINRSKIDYLTRITYREPRFVLSHLNEINLPENEKVRFHKSLYNALKGVSSSEAEAFLNTLAFKDEILESGNKRSTASSNRVQVIGQAFKKYYDFKLSKAFAVALGDEGAFAYSYVVNKPTQDEANQQALERCDGYRYKHNIASPCKIYAEGDVTLFNLTP